MEPQEAKIYVDNLYKELYEHWDRKINRGPFMSRLRDAVKSERPSAVVTVAAAFALYVIGWLTGSADNPAQALFGI